MTRCQAFSLARYTIVSGNSPEYSRRVQHGANESAFHRDFNQKARAAPRIAGPGLEDAFGSGQTPPFAELVMHLFTQSNADERARLNRLLTVSPPGAADGILKLIGPDKQITPQTAQAVFAGHDAERRGGEPRALSAGKIRPVIDMGSGLRNLNFYASQAVAVRGEEVLVCYGVQEARKVVVEPPIGEVWPAFGRCVAVRPQHDTAYKLTAYGASGQSTSA